MEVTVRIDGAIRVPLTAPARFRALLRGACTIRNPDRRTRRQRGAPEEESICLAAEQGGDLVIPRGAYERVVKAAKESGVTVVWQSRSVSRGGPSVRVDGLRDYQEAAVDQFLARRQILVDMPPGAGKTTMGAAAILRTGEPAIVLCPTNDIADQWVARIESAGGGRTVRRLTGSRSTRELDPSDVVVTGSATSLLDRPAVINSAGILVADEAHHGVSASWAAVINACPARYRLGLTATPDRPDGWHVALPFLFGSTLVATTARELISRGLLDQPLIIPVATRWRPGRDCYPDVVRCTGCGVVREYKHGAERGACPSRITNTAPPSTDGKPTPRTRTCGVALDAIIAGAGSLNWTEAVNQFTVAPGRTAIAVELAAACAAAGRLTLLLVPRVDACARVCAAVRAAGASAAAITGDADKAERRLRVEQFRARRFSVLVATQLADEGLDIPTLDAVIVTSAGKAAGRATQRAGRSSRPTGRRPLVFDLVDGGEEFQRQWRQRSRGCADEFGASSIACANEIPVGAALEYLRRFP